jgi:hypothetical protein
MGRSAQRWQHFSEVVSHRTQSGKIRCVLLSFDFFEQEIIGSQLTLTLLLLFLLNDHLAITLLPSRFHTSTFHKSSSQCLPKVASVSPKTGYRTRKTFSWPCKAWSFDPTALSSPRWLTTLELASLLRSLGISLINHTPGPAGFSQHLALQHKPSRPDLDLLLSLFYFA